MKRALRRAHNARMLRRAKAMVKEWGHYPDEETHKLWARQLRDNMQICSCSGCGNPRRGYWSGRLEKLTMQEIKSEDSFRDQLEEYYEED